MSYKVVDGKDKFLGADFHVHTPASKKCYKGSLDDNEYIEVLRRYKNKDINIIAITDHNSICGYKKIINIKEEIYSKYNFLKTYVENYPDLEEEHKKVKEDIKLFEEMLILPGVEFEAKPGIHLLFIFDPNTKLEIIEKFLVESGYSEDLQGNEEISSLPNLDVIEALSEATKIGAITIAAHVDSKKGIYNNLSGTYRANVFKSPSLHAISYNSVTTCEKIKSIYQQKEYKREHEIAYIQSSDYHGEDEVGKAITFLRLEEKTFDAIKEALENPVECVSPTAHPKLINIIEKIVLDENSKGILELEITDTEILEIRKLICSILNNSKGTLVLGATKGHKPIIRGIKKDLEEIKEMLTGIFQAFKQSLSSEVTVYPFGNEANILVIRFKRKSRYLYHVDNNVYIFKEGIPEQAAPREIEYIVEKNILERMKIHEKIIKPQFENSINKLNLYKDVTGQFMIINKVEKLAENLSDIVKLSIVKPNEKNSTEFFNYIGEAEGNVYIVDKTSPRLEGAYLRLSCPVTAKYEIDDFESPRFEGEAIVIAPGGGVFYINNPSLWTVITVDKLDSCLVLQLHEVYKEELSMLSIAVWLKSSLLLWYADVSLGGMNIHNAEVYNKLIIAHTSNFYKGKKIYNLANKILNVEKEFLIIASETECITAEFSDIVDQHNSNVDLIAGEIDEEILNNYHVTEEEKDLISTLFTLKNIHNIL